MTEVVPDAWVGQMAGTSPDTGTKATVAIFAANYWPEQTGIGQVVTEFAEYLAAHGVAIDVVTAMPYYPQWQIHAGYRGRIWCAESHASVHIRRSWHRVSPKPSSVGRLLHEISLSLLAIPNMIRCANRADVVFVACPALSYAFTGSVVARMLGKPYCAIVFDVMPEAAIELGMLRNPFLIAVSRWLARSFHAGAYEIHTLSAGMQSRIQATLPSEAKRIRIVPVTVDEQELAPPARTTNEFRAQFVPDGTFAVVHAGNMGQKQDLGLLLRAAERLRDRSEIRFYVFGDGAVREAFLQERDARGLGNVSHHALVERRLLPHMLAGADVLLVSQEAAVADIVVPSKLPTAMAAGAMIVAACSPDSETARLVTTSKGGLLVNAGDDEALARTIAELADGTVDVTTYRQRARAFAVDAFDRDSVYAPIVDDVARLARPARRAAVS